ncbi:MAG: hypothetical protein G01um10147_1028 [Microgenomates group bacterium Gr01-1014_7]|nr:MAG: hypothetical protein G01um10147_1028 [Microgenomates group bacterium Gr01-1014_7]
MPNIFIVILTVIISVAIAFVFFFTGPKKIDPKPVSDTLGQTVSSLQNSVEDTKENLEQKSNDSVNNIKDTVYETAKNTLDTVFGKNETKKETVSINEVSTPLPDDKSSNVYSIDLSKETNLKITIAKNNKYYLKFANVPSDYCLYIKDQKIELVSGKIIELQFPSSGSFPIKTSICNFTERSIGEIIVE